MKIGLVIHTFDPEASGKEIVNWYLVKGLLERGHEVHLIAHDVHAPAHPDLHVHRASKWGKWLGIHRWTFAVSARKVARSLSVDLMVTNGKSMFGHVVREGGLRKSNMDQISSSLGSPRRILYRLGKTFSIASHLALYLERKTFYHEELRRIIVPSSFLRDELLRFYPDVAANQIEVVYNGIDTDEFDFSRRDEWREEIRSRLNLDRDRKVALFVSNDFQRKGIDDFLQFIENHPSWRGIVVGEDTFPDVSSALRDRLDVTGGVEHVGPYYAAADCLLLPTRSDGFGLVVLEALAMGCYVCVSKNCGAREIIQDPEIGYVFDLGDPPVPTGVEETLRDPEGIRSRARYAASFGWDDVVDEYEHIFLEVKKALDARKNVR